MSKVYTFEQVIQKANEVHNDYYNYTKVNYINLSTKVVIGCKDHGFFSQSMKKHLSGQGCPQCSRLRTKISLSLTQDEFIEKANRIFGEKTYDYSNIDKSNFNSKTKIKIYCKKHGYFAQMVSKHLQGHKCPKCSMDSRKDKLTQGKIEFIERSNKIWNIGFYDYSLVDYINARTKVIIICKKHGPFEQVPMNHLRGYGCSKCGNEKKGKIFALNNEEVDSRVSGNSIKRIGNYIKDNIKIEWECNVGHRWLATPNQIFFGKSGCPICTKKRLSQNLSLTLEEFINKANKAHSNKYEYTKIPDYKNAKVKLAIVCKKHGVFLQTGDSHLSGHGCPKCKNSRGEAVVAMILDEIGIQYIQQKKFDGCKLKKSLPFDFYLPKYNIIIEYNGEQHYKVRKNSYFMNEEKFEELKKRDLYKRLWAKENGIEVIDIHYEEKDIKNYLLDCIKNLTTAST